MNNIKFSKGAVDIIGILEDTVLHVYPDPATKGEPYTIGIGSTHYCDGTKVKLGDPNITLAQADEMLLCYLNGVILPMLQKYIKVQLNQNQIDALGSLCYNIGNYGFEHSHVLSDINQGILSGDLQTRWYAWNKANGKVNPVLVNRRKREYNYFETGKLS